ncbi:MAG: nucleotide-binding protein [Acidocella sp.]|nr:nucleotide-binding protein [Acidocella sp.]
MAIDFDGSEDDLKTLVASKGIDGEWSTDGNGKIIFRAKKGGVLNFWETTGRVQCQGSADKKAVLEAMFSGAAPSSQTTAAPSSPYKAIDRRTKIFVVHGHDHTALEQLELVLRRLNLDPYILQNNDGQSKTIIEALEQQIYKEAAFGIVLMTPDDFGYSKAKGEQERQPRARQNVVLEMGMVFASLGRDRMVILKKGALEIPSDIDGVLRLEFNDHVKEIAVKLATRMKGAGIEIDDSLIHRAGA